MTLTDWKSLQITQEVFLGLQNLKQAAIERLTDNAGVDPIQDRYLVGAIAAYNDMLNITADELHD